MHIICDSRTLMLAMKPVKSQTSQDGHQMPAHFRPPGSGPHLGPRHRGPGLGPRAQCRPWALGPEPRAESPESLALVPRALGPGPLALGPRPLGPGPWAPSQARRRLPGTRPRGPGPRGDDN